MLYLDKQPVHVGTFPNRELYVECGQALDPNKEYEIGLRFESSDDLIALGLLKKALEDRGIKNISLYAPFFPYSTMDHTDGSRALSLKYFGAYVNALNFTSVKVLEPHSTVLQAVVDRVICEDHTIKIVQDVLSKMDPHEIPIIVFPDLGAKKRYGEKLTGYQQITCEKQRDFATGKITGMRNVDPIPGMEHMVFIIMDDLCRGGRTFMECAKLLRAWSSASILLCVTHIENGAFETDLLKGTLIDRVYATNSCLGDKIDIPETLILYQVW